MVVRSSSPAETGPPPRQPSKGLPRNDPQPVPAVDLPHLTSVPCDQSSDLSGKSIKALGMLKEALTQIAHSLTLMNALQPH